MRLAFFAVCLFAGLICAEAQTSSEKKGWGGGADVAATLKAHWYYNWTPHGGSTPGVLSPPGEIYVKH